jgi:HSP20 family molecular chaperone IbpA
MKAFRTLQMRLVHGASDEVSYHLTRVRFAPGAAHSWRPAINAYRCETCIRLCVDLAGVDREEIDLQIMPSRLVLRGVREAAEPKDEQGRALQTLAMEIDFGAFERSLDLPAEVDTERATAEQKNGLLWICLPLKN